VRVPEREQEIQRAPLFEDAAEMKSAEVARPAETPEEFEIVLGRRQIASVLFVATVILALFSAVSYLAGQSISPRKIAPIPPATAVAVSVPATEVSTPAPTVPMLNATIALSAPPPAVKPAIGVAKSPGLNTSTITVAPITAASKTVSPRSVPPTSVAPAVLREVSTDAPVFAEPVGGAMYLQMGAVDRGAAAIFAEGLRKRGFHSFVATGPNATLFRVLIGPLRDTAEYARTKDALDRIGVNTFGRTYEK
jgi:cell division protein FtsN